MSGVVGAEPVRSNFDTTLGFMFFNIPTTDVPSEVADIMVEANRRRKDSPEAAQEYIDLLMGLVATRYYPLVAHEWSHALQAIAYPALYVRCLRECALMFGVLNRLIETPGRYPLPLGADDDWREMIDHPPRRVRIEIGDEGSAAVESPEPNWPQRNDLSEVDLLEDSASIFQYKAEIGGESSAKGYRRWLEERHRHRYRRTFDFLSALLSPEDAYVAIPGLVMAAHMTNQPLKGFASLLAMTVSDAPGPPSEMGVDAHWGFLEESLERSLSTGIPEPRRSPLGERELFRIDRRAMLKLIETGREHRHPIAPIAALAWSGRKRMRRLREAMLHPAQAFDRRSQAAEEWLEPYRPAATGFRLLDDRLSVGATPLRISQTLLDEYSSVGEKTLTEYLLELMRIKAFVYASTTPFLRKLPHNCPHVGCTFHRHDMCRKWIHVPPRFEECEFPAWLAKTTKHRLDASTGVLVPAND